MSMLDAGDADLLGTVKDVPGVNNSTPLDDGLLGEISAIDDTQVQLDFAKTSAEGYREEEIEEVMQRMSMNVMPEVDKTESGSVATPSEGVAGPSQKSGRKHGDEDNFHPNWRTHKKHFFILNSSGKPIYSRYGDEMKLSGFMGILQAMISFVQDADDNLRQIDAGDHTFVYVTRGPIYLIAASSTGESTLMLKKQLNFLYLQIVSILTSAFIKILQKKATYDLRNLLGGAEKIFDRLCRSFGHNFASLIGAVHCLRMPSQIRNQIGQIMLNAAKVNDIFFAILMYEDKLITLVRNRKHTLHPNDMTLIFNTVNASDTFRQSESWFPICLPQFNDKGYMYGYADYLFQSDICLLLLTPSQDHFYACREARNAIAEGIEATGLTAQLRNATAKAQYTATEAMVPELSHFLYANKVTYQFTAPSFEAPYHTKREEKRLVAHLHCV
eukprot:TRINITY_DN3770_c0_g1_i3.p1 TRINITY_DN3770_c0_g1~~TRINITY_DN3770_c0_g1_i3.p1  ORF type:complete len:443 (+),score=94.94 TRINITY_DN3770_c0_g1_i3:52-1380(+)